MYILFIDEGKAVTKERTRWCTKHAFVYSNIDMYLHEQEEEEE